MDDSELDFADDQSEALKGSLTSSISSSQSQTSSVRSNDAPKRKSAVVLMMGRSKKKRLKERQESSQSSQDSIAAGSIASSLQEPEGSRKSSASTISRKPTKKRYKALPRQTLTKVPENEAISCGTYRNDHFSVKDSAQSQMLLDECLFLCESIVRQRYPLETMQSLEEMLSNGENRRQLFFTALGSQSLKGVLDVFAWIDQFVTTNTDTTAIDSSHKFSASPQVVLSDTTSTTSSAEVLDKRPILDTAKMVAYHISLDCTVCPQAAHAAKNQQSSAAAARRIRLEILSNPACMQGLFQLVLDDEVTDRLRDNEKGRMKETALLASVGETSPGSTQTVRVDPTFQGRMKRKQLKLARSGSSCGDSSPEAKSETLSFGSSAPSVKRSLLFTKRGSQGKETRLGDSQLGDRSQEKVKSLVTTREMGQHEKHSCRDEGKETTAASTAALLAVKRIISSKHEDYEQSAIDDDEGHEVDEGCGDDYNPIVATNQLMSRSGALPHLSRALSNSLVAAISQTRFQSGGCKACSKYVSNRVCSLAAMADAASLFNASNRADICNEGFTPETNGYLVVGMLSFLSCFLGIRKQRSIVLDGVWGEIVLSILKTLTSLSHENEVVANELKTKLAFAKGKEPSESTGLSILVAVLRACVVTKARNDRESKMLYDCQIYCLSVLANIAVNRGCVEILRALTVLDEKGTDEIIFLKWLTRWLVSLTKSFHTAIMESSFAASGSIHDDRILNQSEEEGLVAAGKGFIFLSRIMVQDCGSEVAHLIFAEIPGKSSSDKMKMVKNTLKAFLSFYRQSVGGLSVAIFAPLQALLKKLDALEPSSLV